LDLGKLEQDAITCSWC